MYHEELAIYTVVCTNVVFTCQDMHRIAKYVNIDSVVKRG